MKRRLRAILTNLLVLGMAIAFLVHFCLIAAYGAVTIYEHNTLVLALEIAFFSAVIVFAVLNIIKIFRGKGGK